MPLKASDAYFFMPNILKSIQEDQAFFFANRQPIYKSELNLLLF